MEVSLFHSAFGNGSRNEWERMGTEVPFLPWSAAPVEVSSCR